jgi:hypothetical protein
MGDLGNPGTHLRRAIKESERNLLFPLYVEMKNLCHSRHNKYRESRRFAAVL